MKKAKRLLAVLMAFVMVLSAACVNVYAFNSSNNYREPGESRAKYYLNYEQSCGWLLDMLDGLLADANLILTCDELDDMIGVKIITELTPGGAGLHLDEKLEIAGNPKGVLDLRSVDGIIRTLAGVFDALDGSLVGFANFLTLLGDLTDTSKGLNPTGFDLRKQRHLVADSEVLEMLILWLSNQSNLLTGIVSGTFNYGSILEDVIGDLLTDLTGYTGGDTQKNVDYALMTMLYGLLIDDSGVQITSVDQFDAAVQQLVDWALIDGTGMTAAEGANSLLGPNFEPLMGEALGKQPGGASLTGIPIQADHDLDGVPEAHTMSFYQLVNNVIRALLDEMVVPLLTDVLCDALDVEITEDQPYGDPEILNDQMFTMIVGLVESLLVQNGAPAPEYTEDQNTYPLLKIQALLDWLFNKGGLDTFILIDYQGIHLQDNLMSLLNDLIRLLVKMLPEFGLFTDSAHLGFKGDELNAIWFYAEDESGNKVLVAEDAEGVVDQTYVPYENPNVVFYATNYEEIDGVTVATAYNYIDTDMPVNISDKDAADYFNPDFIRPNYVIATDKVYATVIKMALNDFIDGCYFPEWANDIPSVLAYGMAGLASQALPQNNYYARLDAAHTLEQAGGIGVVTDGNNNVIEPIPYETVKRIKIKDIHGTQTGTQDVVIPKGALDIGCSYLAAYLNNILMLNKSMVFSTDTTFEKFLTQFVTWALDQYMPVLIGYDLNGNGVYGEESANELPGLWTPNFNTLLSTVYSDVATLTFKSDVETYTSEGVMKIDAVYDLIDATLFSLLPTSWLPDINTSSQLINSWLLNNLIEFDLIGILDLLTVNMDYTNGELNQPALTVVLRIIDRVLAFVFNGNSVLIPVRDNVLTGGGHTSVTTLGQLLSCRDANGNASVDASLPTFISRLLLLLNKYKYELLSTALPLIAGMDYIRSFTEDGMLESSMTKYGVENLEGYISELSDNLNATLIIEKMADRETAEAIVDGKLQIKRNSEGTAYDIIITTNDSVYGSYTTKEEADAVLESFKNTYLEEVVITEATAEAEAVYGYNIWRKWSYIESAERSDEYNNDKKGTVSTFSGFKFSDITNRTTADPFVKYEQDQFQFLRYEDYGHTGYWYTGAKDALKDADSFASSYRDFSANDLSNAYHEWFMHSVEAQLYNRGKLDTNNDGIVTATDITVDNGDGTTTVVNYADDTPSIPTSMYPFRTTTSTEFSYVDYTFGAYYTTRDDNGAIKYYNTINMAYMNEANYEQLALALEMAEDDRYDVEFSREEVQSIVRLALADTPDIDALQFDIIPDGRDEAGNLTYNGIYQWDDLSIGHLNTIAAWLASRGLTYKAIENSEYGEGEYTFFRPRFRYITVDNSFVTGVSPIPMSTAAYDSLVGSYTAFSIENMSYAEEVNIQIYKSYREYVKSLYDNRKALYDNIDYVSYMYENAEANRSKTVETKMLEWATNTFKDSYEGNAGLNQKYDGVNSDGTLKITKLYTAKSYEKFRIAYNYAESLIKASSNSILADDELTQSMASEAFYGLIDAYYKLVPFTGPADWTQLEAYIALANAIKDDPLSYDENVGYNMEDGQWAIMEQVLADSIKMTKDETIDCERQSEVDDMAAALNQAIYKLNYLTSPDIVSNVNEAGEKLVGTVITNVGAQRITGQIFGLEEGVGAIMDLIQIVGMREDETSGTTVTITGSGRGMGTGAYFIGTVENKERFRYYAVVYGDINGDTRIDGTDASALEIAAMTSSGEELTQADVGSAAKFEAADANHDGKVDNLDIEKIVNHYTYADTISQDKHSKSVVVNP